MGLGSTDGARRHIDYIDGLRAVAVLAVIAYHLDEAWLPGGFAGVDVFFVISGFVVSASLARIEGRNLLRYLGTFYSRRIRRIAPALVLCLLVTGVAAALLIPPAWLSDANQTTGERAFLGISNLFLLNTAGDYFAPAVEFNPYTHTWSLGVEEQFYLVFPLLFFAWSAFASRRWISIALIAAGVAISLAYAAKVSGERPAAAFYLLTSRFWELGAGALLFQLMSLRPAAKPAAWATPGALASAVVLIAGLWLARPEHTPFPDSLLAVAGTLGVLACLQRAPHTHPLRRALEARPSVAVGRISYSLYLWHWPVFVLFRWTSGLESLPARAVALAITFAAATASYRFVERPFRYARIMQRAPRYAVVTGGIAAVLLSAGAFREIGQREARLSLSVVTEARADWFPTGGAGRTAACPGESGSVGGGSYTTFARACGRPAGARIHVLGDSHALGYETMLKEAAARSGQPVTLYYRPGCAVLNLRPGAHIRNPTCERYVAAAIELVARRARPGDVVFLSSLRLARLTDAVTGRGEAAAQRFQASEAAVEGRRRAIVLAEDALVPLGRRGVRIVFEAPPPMFRAPAFRCSDWFNRRNPVCRGGLALDRGWLERYRAPVMASLRDVAATVPNTSVWDPFPILCPGRTCRAVQGGKPLFFDGDHLSGHGNRVLVPSFLKHLDAAASLPRQA